MTSRIPHLLEPYLGLPPEAALVVLTNVLGASTNWLVCRHLHALLRSSPSSSHQPYRQNGEHQSQPQDQDDVAVLLVSFLRDYAFWRDNLSRLGVDLETAARRGKFGYMDGLGAGLFAGSSPSGAGPGPGIGMGMGIGAGRGVPAPAVGGGAGAWKLTPASTSPGEMAKVITEAVGQLKRKRVGGVEGVSGASEGEERKVVLVVDGLDFVLAAAAPGQQQGPAVALRDMLLDLREKTYTAIVTFASDDALMKEQETTLEKQHAWFALNLAHEAHTLFSLRLLDTGAAKDVSGVIRITRGGCRPDGKDQEYLYHVGGDGGVRVFERGQ